METYDKIKLEENRKLIAYARGCKPIRDIKYYLEDQFAANQYQKDQLSHLRHAVQFALREVESIDRNIEAIDSTKLEHALVIGRKARALKQILNSINESKKKPIHKFSIPKYMNLHFKKDIRRINEYMAARKANRIVSKSDNESAYTLTHLTIMGQGLGSRNLNKRSVCNQALKTNVFPDKTLLSDTKANQIESILAKLCSSDSESFFEYLGNIAVAANDLHLKMKKLETLMDLVRETPYSAADKDEIFLKSSKVLQSSETILESIKQVREKLRKHIKLTGSGQNQ